MGGEERWSRNKSDRIAKLLAACKNVLYEKVSINLDIL